MTHFDRTDDHTDCFRPLSLCLAEAIDSAVLSQPLAFSYESPIEVELGLKIMKALRVTNDVPPTLSLGTQYELGPFRYDLVIVSDDRVDPLALIECDGKDFHSTARQLQNDRWKNNLAASRGILLCRFTGSQINREPDLCVAEILYKLRWRGHLTFEQCERLDAAGIRRHRPVPTYEPY